MKHKNNVIEKKRKKPLLHMDDLKNLDEFIQKCLDKFKFVEPQKELYESTGNDKDIIISHKSTIPDLVIWNKSFNKNNCFIGANTKAQNKFPRYLFYIKIKKSKKSKMNNNLKNNSSNNNNDCDSKFIGNKDVNQIEKINDEKSNNIIIEDKIVAKNENNINNINNNYENNKYKKDKKEEDKNKFSFTQNNINVNKNINNLNNINVINYIVYLVELYLDKNGWIILTKDDNFSGPGTSLDLFQYLQEKIKENTNLNDLTIIDINKQIKYSGNYFYILLCNILPKIIRKRQFESIKYDKMQNKQHHITNNFLYNNNNPINFSSYFSKNNNSISLMPNYFNQNNIINNNINLNNKMGLFRMNSWENNENNSCLMNTINNFNKLNINTNINNNQNLKDNKFNNNMNYFNVDNKMGNNNLYFSVNNNSDNKLTSAFK